MSRKPPTFTDEQKAAMRARWTTHGLSYTPEYRAWQQMIRRCTVATHPVFHRYGGRGITVCDRWLGSVQAFIADMGERPEGHELDRRDNDGPYSPENCRWVTRKVNDRNRSSNFVIEHGGHRRTLAEWEEVTGLPADVIRKRLRTWPTEKALTTPVMRRGPTRRPDSPRNAIARRAAA